MIKVQISVIEKLKLNLKYKKTTAAKSRPASTLKLFETRRQAITTKRVIKDKPAPVVKEKNTPPQIAGEINRRLGITSSLGITIYPEFLMAIRF
jgi:hypothetical protein